MSTRYKVIATVIIALTLVAGCGKAEPTATPAPPTNTPVPPTLAPTPAPTESPVSTATTTVKRLREWADLRPGQGPVYSQGWSPDSRLLVTADYDQVGYPLKPRHH